MNVQTGERRFDWKVFGVLVTGALLGSWAVIPYTFMLTGPMPPSPVPLWLLLVVGTVQNLLLFAAVTGLGLWLGDKVGLGAPLLRAWLSGDPRASRRFWASVPLSIGAGAAAGIAILLFDQVVFAPLLPEALRTVSPPPTWQSLLASFYGGINEELLMRLGLMTLLVWGGTKLVPREQPSAGIIWTANVLAALLFGAGHLPATSAIAPLTTAVVVRALLLNGIAGVTFGWLYWRRGLLPAMVAHFSTDIVLHVIGAAAG